jgi:hypothetical protein
MPKASISVVRGVFQGHADCEERWWLEEMRMEFCCGEDFQARLQNVPVVRKLKLSSYMQPHSAEIEHLHPRDGTAMTRF